MADSEAALAALGRAVEHDRAGREAQAIPEYEEALRLGLDAEHEPGALLGLGSSLRNVGRIDDSIDLLTEACARYPDDAALPLFRAISLATAGRDRDALVDVLVLARMRVPAPEVVRYSRALELYTEELAAG